MDLTIRYSFGGTREAPLVQRTIPFALPSDDVSDLQLQEALLERTELLLADLCAVFDTAMAACAAAHYKDTTQVDTMMGACFYAVRNVLLQSPSAKYALFFGRVQQLLNLRPQLVTTLGAAAVDTLSGFVLPLWEDLKRVDATFAPKSAPEPRTCCDSAPEPRTCCDSAPEPDVDML